MLCGITRPLTEREQRECQKYTGIHRNLTFNGGCVLCKDCANNHSETRALWGTAKATKAALTIDGLVVFLGVSERCSDSARSRNDDCAHHKTLSSGGVQQHNTTELSDVL